jgi:hypothetical protein
MLGHLFKEPSTSPGSMASSRTGRPRLRDEHSLHQSKGNESHAVADALAARGVPFVFATGYGGRDIRVEDRDRPVLKKPFQYEKLVEILTRLLSR